MVFLLHWAIQRWKYFHFSYLKEILSIEILKNTIAKCFKINLMLSYSCDCD